MGIRSSPYLTLNQSEMKEKYKKGLNQITSELSEEKNERDERNQK